MSLHNQYFFHGMIRKYVVSFGNIFNNVHVVRYNQDGTERFREKVNMTYGPKEKWLYRTEQNPETKEHFAIKLPRISFELREMRYDATRKTPSTNKLRHTDEVSGQRKFQFNAVPYEFVFDVYFGGKNSDECLQMVEQILPFFTPDHTLTITAIPELNHKLDIPITLNSINIDDTWDSAFEERRHIIWSMSFSLRGFLYPPTRDSKIILQAEWNIDGFGNDEVPNTNDDPHYSSGIETQK